MPCVTPELVPAANRVAPSKDNLKHLIQGFLCWRFHFPQSPPNSSDWIANWWSWPTPIGGYENVKELPLSCDQMKTFRSIFKLSLCHHVLLFIASSSPTPVGLNTIRTEAEKQVTWTAKSVQVLILPERKKKKKVISSELRRNPRA